MLYLHGMNILYTSLYEIKQKKSMIRSLRNKLLIGLLSFSLISLLIIIPSSNYYFEKKENISDIIHQTDLINKYIIQDFRTLTDFFRYDISNPDFFIKKYSVYLEEHANHVEAINHRMENLLANDDLHFVEIRNEINHVRSHYKEYLTIVNQVVQLILERGFKDYGTVGEMRSYIHQLEGYKQLDQTQVLSLRRHEKDYIIRHQEQYITKLNDRAENFRNQIQSNPRLTSLQRKEAISILNSYVHKFNEMVAYDKQIGLYYNSGLKKELDYKENQIEDEFAFMIGKAMKKKEIAYAKLQSYYVGFFIFLVGLIILVSSYASRRFTQSLISLAEYISEFVKNGFYHSKKLKIPDQKDEITILYKELENLILQLDKREQEKIVAKEHLKENEIHFRELANMLPQCVFETDSLGNFTYVNKTWIETFGYSRKEIKHGLNITDTITSELSEKQKESNKLGRNEFLAKRKDGSVFNALVYTNRVLRNNAIVGKRGILIDNTERRRYLMELEEAKKKAEASDKLKSSFLANMSHEIRTPVHAIMGFSDLLKDTFDDREKQQEFIQIIQKSSEDLLHLIGDVIDVAKIEAGEIKVKKKPCNLNALLDELYFTFQAILQQKNKSHLSLKLSKPTSDVELYIETDLGRLKQIFNNLLSNAIKFTAHGSIEFGYTLGDDNQVQFYVKDTGIGIEKNQINLIFKRFQQAHTGHTREYGGTGLGLTISKSLVQLLGGEIWVDSVEGKGSTFYFSHPILDDATGYSNYAYEFKSNKQFHRWSN
jgi:PAS domain S-box-containing protein